LRTEEQGQPQRHDGERCPRGPGRELHPERQVLRTGGERGLDIRGSRDRADREPGATDPGRGIGVPHGEHFEDATVGSLKDLFEPLEEGGKRHDHRRT
jgi:hypothetical protein